MDNCAGLLPPLGGGSAFSPFGSRRILCRSRGFLFLPGGTRNPRGLRGLAPSGCGSFGLFKVLLVSEI